MKYFTCAVAILLLCAMLCSCTEGTADPAVLPAETTAPIAGDTSGKTSGGILVPGDPQDDLPEAPDILRAEDVRNRYDFFPEDIISVCNTKYRIPDKYITEMQSIMDEYDFDCTFYVIDLATGMSVGYNADSLQATASTVKVGFSYACVIDMAETDDFSLDDRIVYRARHKLSGSGDIQHSVFGTIFTVRAVMHRVLYNSDNTAYMMLLDYFGTDHYNALMESLGVSHRLNWDEERWGYLSAHELGLIWQSIYGYRDKNDMGRYLWDEVTTNEYNEIHDTLTEYETVAHKSGWNEEGFHDSGVVCTPDGDYVIVVMTRTGERNRCLHRIVRALDDVMKDYHAWVKSVS